MFQACLLWKKKKCQLPKISKEKGQIDIVVGMFCTILVLVVVLFGFRTTEYVITSAYVEDALAASNLASGIVDLEEYGKTHIIKIKDPESAFLVYREALCHNLKLDEYLNTTNREIIAGKVEILDYRIFNVIGETVFVYQLDESGRVIEVCQEKTGEMLTPDGILVENTTIYSRISFEVRGFGEQNIRAIKEKSIDIVRCEDE